MERPTYETTVLNQDVVELLRSQEVLGFKDEEIIPLNSLKENVLVFNFILGSWCPMCMKHIARMVEVLNSIGKTDYHMIVVTTETTKSLKDSLERVKLKNYLKGLEKVQFISGASKELLNTFAVRMPIFGFAKPATIVVEELKTAKLISKGVPNEERVSCEVSYWLNKAA
jgi:peroxiredoxin